MSRFILRTLLGVPAWLLYFVLMLPLMAIGFPLVAVLALYMQLKFKYTSHVRANPQLRFPAPFGVRLFYLWENDEDGVDGDPWTEASGEPKNPEWFEATANWTIWRKVFVWSAWRNSVGNARRVPFFGMTMADPSKKVTTVPPYALADMRKLTTSGDIGPIEVRAWWNEYRKLGPYIASYGWRFELRFPWPNMTLDCGCGEGNDCVKVRNTPQRFFWIGWRIAQQDQPNTDIGFAFQPWAKL